MKIKKELPEGKKMYKVTLDKKFPRIVFKYNPKAVKNFKDKSGNLLKKVENDGTGYAFNIKLVNDSLIILDTKTQEFMINKLILSGKIVEYEQWKIEEENKELLESMQKESENI